KSTDDMAPYSISKDGQHVFFRLNVSNTGVLSMGDRVKAEPLWQSGFTQSATQVSPDGRWLAYGSNESGAFEVYIRSYPDITGKWQVSQGGAWYPRWKPDGREPYYYAVGEHLMAVSVAGDKAAEIGAPVPLFDIHMLNGTNVTTGVRDQYDVTSDGQ